MADERSNGSSPELVYVSEPSWSPPLVAVGLAGVVASVFTWWPYGVVGALVALVALFCWFRQAQREHEVLPREQRLTVGALPPTPLRRPRG
jgi:hypothetical protein